MRSRVMPLVIACVCCASPAAAQRDGDGLSADSPGLDVPSPRGAALRSLAVPGWGQAEFGSYVRGGVFFAARTGAWFMVLKTMSKISEARGVEERRVAAARDSIVASLPPDTVLTPFELEEAIAEVPAVRQKRNLIESRKDQREDWIAWLIFWTLADAADAYVNAQLADFPADVDLGYRRGGGLELRLEVPLRGVP